MLNLDQYSSLGAALRDALDRWANETCLIEADRDREKTRLTYSDFKDLALPLARAFEDAEFNPGDRVAIIMTNQSKWLISAYAVFYCGGGIGRGHGLNPGTATTRMPSFSLKKKKKIHSHDILCDFAQDPAANQY